MNVLLVDQYGEIGGGQTVFLQVLEALLAAGAQVEAAIPLGGGLEQAIRARVAGIRLRPIPPLALTAGSKGLPDALALAAYTARLVRGMDLRGCDQVYVNGARLFPAFLLLAQRARARFTYHLHIDYSLLEKAIIAAALHHPRTHRVLANSRFIHERVARSLGPLTRSAKLTLLENALSREQSALAFEDRSSGPLQAVVIGRVIAEKGHPLILDLALRHPGIHFHILGDADFGAGAYLEALRARAGRNVSFHGRVRDVHGAIRALGAQLCLVPSRWQEPFGLVAIEAMAMSCLTITSGRGGLAEIARRTGAWVCRSDTEWEQALARVEAMPRAQLGALAREQHAATQQEYAWSRFEREVRELFAP